MCILGTAYTDNHVGFYSPTPVETTDKYIFSLEALCVLSAICHITDVLHMPPMARVLIYTDNDNTVTIFNTLRCLPHYNPILINAAAACISSNIQLRVLHIPGHLNCVANVISQNNFSLARQDVPDLVISPFLPPQLPLGAPKK